MKDLENKQHLKEFILSLPEEFTLKFEWKEEGLTLKEILPYLEKGIAFKHRTWKDKFIRMIFSPEKYIVIYTIKSKVKNRNTYLVTNNEPFDIHSDKVFNMYQDGWYPLL